MAKRIKAYFGLILGLLILGVFTLNNLKQNKKEDLEVEVTKAETNRVQPVTVSIVTK